MCGRAAVINPDGITEKLYGYTKKFVPSDWKPRYNLNPHEDIPAVYYDPFLKERVLRTMHWNLIPSKLETRDGIVELVGDKKRKQPYLIRHRDRIPFAMAGLWNRWQDRTGGEELWSTTVIVKDADDWYKQFHDRMAVLLAPESYAEWLDPKRTHGQL